MDTEKYFLVKKGGVVAFNDFKPGIIYLGRRHCADGVTLRGNGDVNDACAYRSEVKPVELDRLVKEDILKGFYNFCMDRDGSCREEFIYLFLNGDDQDS